MSVLELSFTHDLKNTDGSDFDELQFAGVEYAIDGTAFLSVPAAFAAGGDFSAETAVDLSIGEHSVAVKVKHADGTASEASEPAFFTVAARIPTRPAGLSASCSR